MTAVLHLIDRDPDVSEGGIVTSRTDQGGAVIFPAKHAVATNEVCAR